MFPKKERRKEGRKGSEAVEMVNQRVITLLKQSREVRQTCEYEGQQKMLDLLLMEGSKVNGTQVKNEFCLKILHTLGHISTP